MNAIKHINECLPAVGYDAKEYRVLSKAIELLKSKLKKEGACVTSPVYASNEAKLLFSMALAEKEREVFMVMFLDTQNRIIDTAELFSGTVDGATVYPREVVKAALAVNATSVIFAHNHPSGSTEESEADKRLTDRLKEALALVDIRVIDHIIVGKDKTLSFAERGIL